MEVEFKFQTDRAGFEALMTLAELGGCPMREHGVDVLTDRYFDTAVGALRSAGFVCRFRQFDSGRCVLTLKSAATATGALHRREEFEEELAPEYMPDHLPPTAIGQRIKQIASGEQLVEVVAIFQRRYRKIVMCAGNGVAQLSLDEVWFDSDGKTQPSLEVELELLPTGTLEEIRPLGDALAALGLRTQSQSKFERALAFARRVD